MKKVLLLILTVMVLNMQSVFAEEEVSSTPKKSGCSLEQKECSKAKEDCCKTQEACCNEKKECCKNDEACTKESEEKDIKPCSDSLKQNLTDEINQNKEQSEVDEESEVQDLTIRPEILPAQNNE